MVTADRVAVVRNGLIEQFDSPTESYNRPRSLFVADFIGRMNQIHGVLDAHSAEYAVVRSNAGTVRFAAQATRDLQAGTPVVGMIRPERLKLLRDATDAPDLPTHEQQIAGTVRDITFIGEKLAVVVDTPFGVLVAHLPNAGSHHAVPAAEDPVTLHWNPQDMLLFPLS
jgi:ABC-type Fe3+/spermidine/putrescine transport system ATPase subunit